eukprot:TRINITY_DN13215_c0_g1_i1.p1 TRINITY_DN13215_c0_g1~~TRINITY_DN13215_c0_g1_i1.p1  ORF type:complete len:261 (+),score=130.32 TRINITY_DN13215_c0_g1_i1:96-785(+)
MELWDEQKGDIFYKRKAGPLTKHIHETAFLDEAAIEDAKKQLLKQKIWVETAKDGVTFYYEKSNKKNTTKSLKKAVIAESGEVVKAMARALRDKVWVQKTSKDVVVLVKSSDTKTKIYPRKLYDTIKAELQKEKQGAGGDDKGDKGKEGDKPKKDARPAAPSEPPKKKPAALDKEGQKKVDNVLRAGVWKLNPKSKEGVKLYYRKKPERQLKEQDFVQEILDGKITAEK